MNIIITGSSGLIGTTLKHRLEQAGHRVFGLVHDDNKSSSKKDLKWSIKNNYVHFPPNTNIDVIIHLAGANIAKPWTKAHKRAILESREAGTRLLVEEIIKQQIPVKKFISTSAIGLYPDPSLDRINENSKAGKGFLSDVCEKWESALEPLRKTDTEVSVIRVGLVLSNGGGVYPIASKTRKLGIIPITGSRANFWSWIHIEDLITFYTDIAEGKMNSGTYNAVAPQPITQGEFAQTLWNETRSAKQAFSPFLISPVIPAFLLKLILGEQSQLALTSQHIGTIHNKTISFKFPKINDAITSLIHE